MLSVQITDHRVESVWLVNPKIDSVFDSQISDFKNIF